MLEMSGKFDNKRHSYFCCENPYLLLTGTIRDPFLTWFVNFSFLCKKSEKHQKRKLLRQIF